MEKDKEYLLANTLSIPLLLSLFLVLLFTPAQGSALTSLTVQGQQIIEPDSGNPFHLKCINFNDNMEFPYGPWDSSFSEAMSWTHTAEDYARVKDFGFNCVRVNLSSEHFDNPTRLDQHVQWAEDNDLYIILAYFTPPGSVADNGYYSTQPFWDSMGGGTVPNYYQDFLEDWSQTFERFKNKTHVLFEILNEPQVDPANSIEIGRYIRLLEEVISKMNETGGTQILIIDGAGYANESWSNFSFISNINELYQNLVYSFHFYLMDFAYYGCNWDNVFYYKNLKNTITSSFPDIVNVTFNFTIENISETVHPILFLRSLNQIGTTSFASVSIYQENEEIFHQDFSNFELITIPYTDTHDTVLYNSEHPEQSWNCHSAGDYLSSEMSEISYIENKVNISNTLPDENGRQWAEIKSVAYLNDNHWGNDSLERITLEPGTQYTASLSLVGSMCSDNGRVEFELRDTNGFSYFIQKIQPFCSDLDGVNCTPKYLCSDIDRIQADFALMKRVAEKYDVPIFLGEFGVPIRVAQQEVEKYFNAIMDNAEGLAGWGFFVYREPFSNRICPNCSDYITFGLYSGEKVAVENMTNLRDQLGESEHYVNPALIGQIRRSLAIKGDINRDESVGLSDAILSLQVLTGMEADNQIYKYSDTNLDDKIGLEETVYILREISKY